MRPRTCPLARAVFAAATLLASAASPARAERCHVAFMSAAGRPQFTAIDIDLESGQPLDREALPEGTSALMCPRSSIIPRGDDIRVLTELGTSFGISEDGPRALWIWARNGRLRTRVEHGRLSRAERHMMDEWRRIAQRRFDETLSRGAHGAGTR